MPSVPQSLALLALALVPVASPAQSTPDQHARAAIAIASAPADTLVKRVFRIEAQPLPRALEEFRRQAGVSLRTETDVPPVHSPGVTGRFTPVEALRRLIAGTGLQAEVVDEETLALRPVSGAYELEPVEVVARRGGAGEVTSTATRTPTPLRDVPQAVTVVSRALITEQAMQGMGDVTRYVPGVTMGQGEGNRDQPTIRGNISTSTFFVNGMRDDVQYFRDLYNVDRVEVLKGPNALIFGRGTGGGLINRVSKEADWTPVRELTLQGGSYDTRRGAVDFGQGVSESVALRFNGMYENSDRFRHDVNLERYGINPTVTVAAGSRTRITADYEHFSDYRTADRGIPSFAGRPAQTDIRTFFGDPSQSWSDAGIDAVTAMLEHQLSSSLQFRSRVLVGDYDKMYQNVFPGSVDSTGTLVSLSAYNNRNDRNNLLSQTDLTWRASTGSVRHTLVAGLDFGRQVSRNLRKTGFFDGTETSVNVPLDRPTIRRPVVFRPGDTDADNRVRVHSAGVFLQDQVALTPYLQLIGGARVERFDLTFHNFRNGEDLERTDDLFSPRAGVVVKPVELLSLYGSYGVSYLPSAGDQFSSLTATSETLEPEKFENYELGAKLDLAHGLALTGAVYQLDRSNTSAPDPRDPARTVQTGSQRTRGVEVGATGNVTERWEVAAGYALQDAEITSRTSQAEPGAKVPVVPRHTLSVWNRYQLQRRWGVGLGVLYQDDMFASIDNTVTLPSFTRFDAGVFFTLSEHLRAQVNVENLFDEEYFITSHSNNNISPGSPRAVRASMTAGF
ncbi:MAG TPA: TonB-dependent siderophore receptor [Gemmatimonadales bacterium]